MPHPTLRTRPRILPREVMEYWSGGVLREVRIAPRVAGWRMLMGRFNSGICPRKRRQAYYNR